MALGKTTGKKEFAPCPIFEGRAVLVDITPPVTVDNKFKPGEKKDVVRFVYEVDLVKESDDPARKGERHCVWSKPLRSDVSFATKNKEGSVKKSGLCEHLEALLGRPLNAQELQQGIDEESLIGTPAYVEIVHNESDGATFANIDRIRPHKAALGEPLKPSGHFTRKKDRDNPKEGAPAAGGKAEYRKADGAGEEASRDDWQKCKVHVGRHKGVEVGDLDEADIKTLVEKWLPSAKANAKPTADDKRLIVALEAALKEIEAAAGAPAAESSDY